jgi:hypothetical protein
MVASTKERRAEAYRQSRRFGVERTFWLFLRDVPTVGYFGSMGLLDAQGKPRPAWRAYKQIVSN